MTTAKLALRSLVHRWRTGLATAAGAAVATAVLVSALGAGDSVRASLRAIALSRLGSTEYALEAGDRFFRSELAVEIAARLGGKAAALIGITGSASARGGEIRVPSVQVLGVGADFASLAAAGAVPPQPGPGDVLLNEQLARRLDADVGDEVLLRMQPATTMPAEAPLAAATDTTTLRLTVAAIVSDSYLGGFTLRIGGSQPLNAFVSRGVLAARIGRSGRSNTILLAPAPGRTREDVATALRASFRIEDAGLSLRRIRDGLELASDRVFLEPAVEQAALAAGGRGVLTYFVDRIGIGDRSIWYSFASSGLPPRVPFDLAADEVLLNEWAARELGAGAGDAVELSFRVPGAASALETRSGTFRVRAVLPIEPGDRDLMPSFPGFAGVKNCRDWDPGVPLDLSRIGVRDQAYWDTWGGSPRAFLSLASAQRLWANRFGHLTAVRFAAGSCPEAESLAARIASLLGSGSVGLAFSAVRAEALAATSHGVDFGQLFLGLGFFLVAAALVLTGLLSLLSVDQRAADIATLAAVGWTRGRIRGLIAAEGALVAFVGGALGVPLGVAFHRAILVGLRTAWHDAVRTPVLLPRIEPISLAAGFAGGLLVSLAVIVLATTDVLHRTARSRRRRRGGLILRSAIAALALGGSVVAFFLLSQPTGFFAAGALLLVGLLAAGSALLSLAAKPKIAGLPTLAGIGVADAARRRTRTLGVASVLACGIFIVTAVSANRIGVPTPGRRDSGTGGFGLYVQTSIPIGADRPRRLASGELAGLAFAVLRVVDGDDASCLNLNRVARPAILGVEPSTMSGRFSFSGFSRDARSDGTRPADPWQLLERDLGPDTIAGFVDANVLTWGLGLRLGDEIAYLDGNGKALNVRLAASLAGSVFQGSLVVSESALLRHFPSTSFPRLLLVEAPAGRSVELAASLERSIATLGASVESTTDRLARFNSVQNTYLAVFGLLGWLGMLIGTFGLAVIVWRNATESRGELALLRAVGFGRPALLGLVLAGHLPALAYGLAAGALASLVAVLPTVRMQTAALPAGNLAVQVAAIVALAVLCVVVAAAAALRGEPLPALREE